MEEAIAGYTTTYSLNNASFTSASSIKLNNTETVDTLTVKNSLTPATTEVEVEKIWDDANNVDGVRPDNVTIKLFERVWNSSSNSYATAVQSTRKATQADVDAEKAENVGDPINQELVLNEANNWNGSFTNLLETKNGKIVLYEVREDQLTNYEAPVITGNQYDGYKVTNTHKQDTVDVEIVKNWVDSSNLLDTRPTVQEFSLMYTYDGNTGNLLAAKDILGNTVPTLKLSDENPNGNNSWKETIVGLPKNIKS